MRAKKERIVCCTAQELRVMCAGGKDKTDWACADAMTETELETAIASDPDEAGMAIDWSKATSGGFEP